MLTNSPNVSPRKLGEFTEVITENVYPDKESLSLDLAPEGNFQLAQADMLANVIGDLESMLSAAFDEKDPDKKVILFLGLYCVLLGGWFCIAGKQKSGMESEAPSTMRRRNLKT